MWKCEKCGEYRWSSVEKCYCKHFVVVDEDGEDHDVQAMDEEGAALKYAQESNESCDYYLMNDSVEVTVNGNKFRISAEPDVHYSVT